jgi:DNA-directed RNA polymerase subunit M/transcription elongation factor TFIIS
MSRENVFVQSCCPACKKIMTITGIDSKKLGLLCTTCLGAIPGSKREFVNGTVLVNYGREESDFIESNRRYFEDLCGSRTTIRLLVHCPTCHPGVPESPETHTEWIFIEKNQDIIKAYLMCTRCKDVREATESEIRRIMFD